MPRRHRPVTHFISDRLGPGTDFLVGHQRHRRDFARAVALGAVLVQDRRDITRECRPPGGGFWRVLRFDADTAEKNGGRPDKRYGDGSNTRGSSHIDIEVFRVCRLRRKVVMFRKWVQYSNRIRPNSLGAKGDPLSLRAPRVRDADRPSVRPRLCPVPRPPATGRPVRIRAAGQTAVAGPWQH